MSPTRIGVLALQGDVREHVEAVQAVGAQPVLVRREAELNSVAALVIPGGESTVMARLARVFGLFEPLQSRIVTGMPVLGTCAGMILLANTIVDPAADGNGVPQESLGGLDVVVRRNAFGRQVESFETDLLITGSAQPLRAVFIRAPRVEHAGPGVEVLASVGEYPVAVRQGALLATAFHPESAGELRFHHELLELAGASA